MMTSLGLLFDGDIDLVNGDADGYSFEALEGIDFGSPVPVEVALSSFLRDGSIVEKTGDGNRELVLPFRVKGSDLLSLAEAEARLDLALGKRTTLLFTPPDGVGPATVFDVETSRLDDPPYNDLAELHNQCTYSLRLTCLPFGRSVGKIVDTAGTPPSTGGTVLYNFESTTGWALTSPSAYTADYAVDSTIYTQGTGSVRSRATYYQNSYYIDPGGMETYSSSPDGVSGLSLSTGTGGYLSVSVRFEWVKVFLDIFVTTATGGRVKVAAPLEMARDAQGFVRYVWPVAGGLTVTALDFAWGQRGPAIPSIGAPASTDHHVWFDDFELLPAATTDHQIVKQLDVKGSARTTGSLHVAAATDSVALGPVLAITVPTGEVPPGFRPDGRRWVTQGTTTADATALWGSYFIPNYTTYDSSAGKPIFDVPVGMLKPGPYTIVAAVNPATTALTFGVQSQLRLGSTNTGPTSEAEIATTAAANVWQFATIGTVYLPPLPMQGATTTAKVRLLFKGANVKLADVYMIPAWQVGGSPVADFSIVDCGTGTVSASGASSNLWIDSPSTDQPQGGWWRGPTADRLNARSAWPDAKKPGIHTFRPGSLTAFLVSTGAQGPTLALEYFPRWRRRAAL